jgi:hypothetical protein
MKRCAKCGAMRQRSQFHIRNRSKDGLNYYCIPCTKKITLEYNERTRERNRERSRAWRLAHPERAKATHGAWIAKNKDRARANHKFRQLRHRYGISKSEYESLMRESGGKCQLCESSVRLCVDHCHKSSVVRGMLCLLCNTAIERLETVPDFIKKAAAYLEKHNE